MIEEGYAHPYDGGTKDMNLEDFVKFIGHMEPLLNKFRGGFMKRNFPLEVSLLVKSIRLQRHQKN